LSCLVFSTGYEIFQQKGDKMQLTEKKIYHKVLVGIVALIWIAGLLIAGSESPFMPWMNLIGVIIFLWTSLWLGRILPQLEIQENGTAPPRPAIIQSPKRSMSQKRKFNVNTSYGKRLSPV
jgi:hypothetical protein